LKNNLAINGGPKTIDYELAPYRSMGEEEVESAKLVIESGVLSKFIGAWHEDFYGGDRVLAFETAWKNYFQVDHAVSVNSATSGLIAAVGALGVELGDEVIVSPWTMCSSATSILMWNGVPVFADIEPETFNLDPVSIEKNITPRTKAIVVPDILGHAADLESIMDIAKQHGLKVIEDAAQAPGAMYKGKYVGTVADIGVFSLNYHKHIHTGEGGVCVTSDPILAERLQLLRNHAEAVVEGKGVSDLTNMIGFNFRMGEIEAAIGIEQLKKLDSLLSKKVGNAMRLSEGLSGLEGLRIPVVRDGCSHAYYAFPLVLDTSIIGVTRSRVAEALKAEGVEVGQGYQNIHLLPMFQKKMAYGSNGFPWSSPSYQGDVSYQKGICPVAEKMHDENFMAIPVCMYDYSDRDVELVVEAFRKVWRNLSDL
jgi:perosamine synthetase